MDQPGKPLDKTSRLVTNDSTVRIKDLYFIGVYTVAKQTFSFVKNVVSHMVDIIDTLKFIWIE